MLVALLAVAWMLGSRAWTESSHADFADGWEYYYPGGDSAETWRAESLRIWRIGSRIYSPAAGGLRVIGQDLDIDDDGWLDLPVSSWCLGPSLVYWGPDMATFSEINPGGAPPMWVNGIFVADFDGDGNPELLVANEVTDEGPHVPSFVFSYSGARGFVLADSIPYPYSVGAQGIQPADLNNDGYLDLVISNTRDYETGSWDVRSYILMGPGPFGDASSCRGLPVPGGHPTAIADLNSDGFLDIVFPSNANDATGWETDMIICWGKDAGYGPPDTTRLPVNNNWEAQIVDLNRDGWLDIIAVNGKDNQGYYTTDRIFWGPDFSTSAELPGVASSNITVGDVNRDGHLDLLISNWARGTHGAETLQTCSYLRYGPDHIGGPVDSLVTYGAHGNLIADWNGDGWPDVFIGNEMYRWGEYHRRSYVFWNSGPGFGQENATRVEVWAPNDCVWTDLGNIYDRTPTERYLSSERRIIGKIVSVDSLRLFGNIPGEMRVEAWVRTGRGTVWDRWVRINGNGRPSGQVSPGDRLQYRLVIRLDYRTTTRFRIDSLKVFYRAEGALEEIREDEPPRDEISEDCEIYDATGRLVGKGKEGNLPRGIYFRVERRAGRPVSAEAIVK